MGSAPAAVEALRSSIRHPRALAQEAHEVTRVAAELEEPVQEAARHDFGLGQVHGRDEVLAFEVLEQRVVAVEACWRTLERLAAQLEVLLKRRRLDDPLPASR